MVGKSAALIAVVAEGGQGDIRAFAVRRALPELFSRKRVGRIFHESDRPVDDLSEGFRPRHFQFVALYVGKVQVKRFLALAGLNPIEKYLGVSEEFAVVAVGGQIPTASHGGDY
jgi:hypothetical protein